MIFKDLFIIGTREICNKVPEFTLFGKIFLFSLGGIGIIAIFWFIFYYIPHHYRSDP